MNILSTYDPRQGLPSASAFGRLALCPGSFMMEKACPEESSPAASEGTLLHAYMEQLLTGEPWEGTPLTAEQVELCERALRLLDGVKEMIERDNPGAVFHLVSTEQRVFYRNLFGTAYYSGQWDALFEVNCPDSSFMMVADWKFGRVEVDSAEANRQLEALVPLVAQKEHDDYVVHQGIYAAIIQPRVAGPASVAFYDAEAIDQAEQRSLAVAKAATAPDAPALLQRGSLPVLPGQGGVP